AIDENVPTALAGYRPRVTGTSSLTGQYLDTLVNAGTTPQTGAIYSQTVGNVAVSSFGLTATQTLFNGFQTASRTRQAEGQVFSAPGDVAHDRPDPPAHGCHRLHEPVADRGHPRAAAQQRERARGDAAADARPLHRRRSHAHRRGAGGIAARRRPIAAV